METSDEPDAAAKDAASNGAAASEGKDDAAAAPADEASAAEPPKPSARVVIETSRLTSARLQKECIYMETGKERYELVQEDAGDRKRLTYRLSRVMLPQLLDQAALCTQSRPLALDLVEIVHENLKWRQVKWSPTGVSILGVQLQLTCLRFIPRTSDAVSPAEAVGAVRSFTSREARARASKQKRKGTATVGPVAVEPKKSKSDDAADMKSDDDKLDGDAGDKAPSAKGKSSKGKTKGKSKDSDSDTGAILDDGGDVGGMAASGGVAAEEAPAQRSSRRTKGKPEVPAAVEKAEKRGSARTAGKRTRGGAQEVPEEEDKKPAQAKGGKRPKRGR